MSTIAYALREAYAGTIPQEGPDGVTREVPVYMGGLLGIDDERELNVLDELEAGNGTIVVDESDTLVLNVLDNYPPLKRVPAPEGAMRTVGKYDGLSVPALRDELGRRELDTAGRKLELVERLEAADALAAGDELDVVDQAPDVVDQAPDDAGDADPNPTPEA